MTDPNFLTRRSVLAGTVAVLATAPVLLARAEQVEDVEDLRPGQFTWHPERAPDGPVSIIVSLPDQRVYVYRNGIRIAVSTCSSGRAGHETPTGVFTILQKDRNHHSNEYSDAPMPNMNRLTWSGIALHAGQLPGYPASHGCVRLPMDFSARLFTITTVGTPVIIANASTFPENVVHPGMVLSGNAETDFQKVATPVSSDGKSSPTSSIIVSSVDRRVMVLDDGAVVAEGALAIDKPSIPLGNNVFVLQSVDAAGRQLSWHAIGYHSDASQLSEYSEVESLKRIHTDQSLAAAIAARMHPGLVLVTVDLPLNAESRTGKDFVILSNAAGV